MTEDEAKTRWCPFVRVGLTAGMAVNQHPEASVMEDTCCRASQCMAWRVKGGLLSDGYCGLAGRP